MMKLMSLPARKSAMPRKMPVITTKPSTTPVA
jgi:hypothetical protein